jgi:hypothetical protein
MSNPISMSNPIVTHHNIESLAELSRVLGVQIWMAIPMEYDHSTLWLVTDNIDKKPVDVELSISQLRNQHTVGNAILNATGCMIPNFHPSRWEEIVQAILAAAGVEAIR